MGKEIIFLDIETYPNYFLIKFSNEEGRFREFELYESIILDCKVIKGLLNSYTTVTFNGLNYDIPMLTLALTGVDNTTLKEASDKLIAGQKPWQFYRQYGLTQPAFDVIDLMEPAPGVMVSLKLYGGRMHMLKMQDLPYNPDTELTREQMIEVNKYCGNDLAVTKELYMRIKERLELRTAMGVEYRAELRSKSDAQVAEVVIKNELERLLGYRLPRPVVKEQQFYYRVPDYIRFETPQLQAALELVKRSPFTAKTNGQFEFAKELADLVIELGNSKYQLGIGGLHSQEHEVYHKADEDTVIVDRDFTSYYPSIILILGLYPESLGTRFLEVYKSLVDRRVEAKRAGNNVINESLKITINGSFGKLGSIYSALYAPDLMIQVTLTGQLTLLMLIERLENRGISVVSANTDGMVIKCHHNRRDIVDTMFNDFEEVTGYQTEEVEYAAVYSRDVNNYIAIGTNGKVKTKGRFSPSGLQKNPENDICSLALIAYLKDGTPIEQTVRECKDITKFVTVRTVRGGGIFENTYLGKVVRWYHGTSHDGYISYLTTGNKVPNSDGATPCMSLPTDFPNDIDYNWYIGETNEMLMDIGLVTRPPKVRKVRSKKV